MLPGPAILVSFCLLFRSSLLHTANVRLGGTVAFAPPPPTPTASSSPSIWRPSSPTPASHPISCIVQASRSCPDPSTAVEPRLPPSSPDPEPNRGDHSLPRTSATSPRRCYTFHPSAAVVCKVGILSSRWWTQKRTNRHGNSPSKLSRPCTVPSRPSPPLPSSSHPCHPVAFDDLVCGDLAGAVDDVTSIWLYTHTAPHLGQADLWTLGALVIREMWRTSQKVRQPHPGTRVLSCHPIYRRSLCRLLPGLC